MSAKSSEASPATAEGKPEPVKVAGRPTPTEDAPSPAEPPRDATAITTTEPADDAPVSGETAGASPATAEGKPEPVEVAGRPTPTEKAPSPAEPPRDATATTTTEPANDAARALLELATALHGNVQTLVLAQETNQSRLDELTTDVHALLLGHAVGNMRVMSKGSLQRGGQEGDSVAPQTVVQVLAALQEDIASLREARQKDIRELQELRDENRQLRDDYYRQSLRPTLAVFLSVFDEAADMANNGKSEDAVVLLRSLEQALGQGFDAWPFRPEHGESLNFDCHRTTGAVSLSDSDCKPNTVATVSQAGFRDTRGQVLRKASVEIYR